jgi:hypothetical protein
MTYQPIEFARGIVYIVCGLSPGGRRKAAGRRVGLSPALFSFLALRFFLVCQFKTAVLDA